MLVLAVAFAVLGAASNAAGTVLQRRAALAVPDADAMSARMVSQLLRQPVWVLGILGVTCAALFQALALNTGPMVLVQPVFVLELPLAMLISIPLLRQRLSRQGWLAVGAMVAGLALFLAAAAPGTGTTQAPMRYWIPALAVCCGAMALLTAAALRRPSGVVRAACLGFAAAIGNALTAALMKSATHTLDDDGIGAFLTTWQTYAFAAAGIASVFLLENALQAGPLIASQPALTLGDALVSLALSLTLFSEPVRTGWWLIPEAAGLALVTAGVVALSRLRRD
ncbi:DMT family transporter [Streptomyces sp. T-3]|nr:DMT family transporter [Streptomyces sp. T-3]